MKTAKITAIIALIVVCATTLLITINSCKKDLHESASTKLETAKYCVGKVTGLAPGESSPGRIARRSIGLAPGE